jgi:CRISPR/Cas system CSM-associated protein Csm2 small subunit
MAGIEIIGLIGAVVGIVQATIAVSDSIKNLKGLPEAFEEVNKRLPLVEETLSAARTQFENEKPSDEAAAKIERILKGCNGKTQELKEIFEKINNAKNKSVLSLYRKIVLKLGKEHRVEVLMKNILKDLQILTGNQTFQAATQSQVEMLQKAIDELSQVKPSIPDRDFESAGNFQHSGKGDLNVQYGDGDMNNVKGDMYKAKKMTFGRKPRSKKDDSSDDDD